jgi:hypothetical protein
MAPILFAVTALLTYYLMIFRAGRKLPVMKIVGREASAFSTA